MTNDYTKNLVTGGRTYSQCVSGAAPESGIPIIYKCYCKVLQTLAQHAQQIKSICPIAPLCVYKEMKLKYIYAGMTQEQINLVCFFSFLVLVKLCVFFVEIRCPTCTVWIVDNTRRMG